jgi:hypothetical protein
VGTGLTVTTAFIAVPTHPFADGVMEYLAVPFTLEVAVSVCAIVLPLPAEAPLTLAVTTVHAYVVPETLFGLVMAIEVGLVEQMD